MIERGKGSNLVQPHFNTEWMHKSFSFIVTIASCGIGYLYILKTPIIFKCFKRLFKSSI